MVLDESLDFLTKKNSRRIMDKTLTNKEAFEAMRIFLGHYDERGGGKDSLQNVLSDISNFLWADGGPNDPAQWDDWLDAVSEVVAARK
jgi:hypothetical protein